MINVICPHCAHVHSSETAYLCDSEGCRCPAGSVIGYLAREAAPNPGIDETARDHDAEALADLGDVGDLDQYDRSTQ